MQTISNSNSSKVDYLDSKARKASSSISNEFHSFLNDVEELFKATTSLTGEDLARAKAKLSARIDAAKESVEELSGTIVHQARKTAAVTNHYVHEQPWTVIGAGAAVSFLLGFLLARRG
jgi:ElaB/YqjD/DUF883 family membrane-anchored ribosome-binding protein